MKFNPKVHQGKDRVYPEVVGAPGIRRVWVWDESKNEYVVPARGKCFLARRYETESGKKARVSKYFESLSEAREWHMGIEKSVSVELAKPVEPTKPAGKLFGELVEEWKRDCYSSLSETTQVAYDKIVRLYLGSLMKLGIHEISPQRVDQWLRELKDPNSPTMKVKRRKSFSHELSVLSTVLRYYENYKDDPEFRYPIKQRHKEAIELKRPSPPKRKDLSEGQFLKFREELERGPYGDVLAALATVQFYQALRISEAAGLFWEDVGFDFQSPDRSRLVIVRAVCWPRRKGVASFVKSGFKNSEANDGIKEQPMFPETFEALMSLYREGKRSLVFEVEGKHFEYRTIQHAYDSAFRRANLPFTGSHVLRHGGCRKVLNETGDMTIAKQHLGNTDMATVQIYAQREAAALTRVARDQWKRKQGEAGRDWPLESISKTVIQ